MGKIFLKHILKLEVKEKSQKIYPIIIFAGVCVYFYVNHFVRYRMFHAQDLGTIMQSQKLAVLCFLAISFLAFDYFSDLNKRSWKELLETTPFGIRSICFARIILLLGIIGVFFLNIVVIDFILVWPYSMMPGGVQENVWMTLILNFILFPVVGMFLGIFMGGCLRRWQGFLLLVIFMLLFIGVFQTINIQLFFVYEGKVNLDILSRILTLTQPNQQWVLDEQYLIPVELYRYFLYFGWMLLFLGCAVFSLLKRKKRLSCVPLWALCVLCFWQVVDAGCISDMNSNIGNAANDFNTFLDEEAEFVVPDFSVKSYDIRLSVAKELKAEVCMKLDRQQNEYQFTLYRGYKLESVKDEDGKPLEYQRDKDYVTVYTKRPASQITMKYSGYSGTFISNSNAILLPGFFAWYPQPGFRPVFIRTIVDTYDSYGYNKNIAEFPEAEFHVKVSGYLNPVYSNLDDNGDMFEGKAKTVTLMGGAVEENVQNDVRIVYPSLMEVPENYVQQYQDELEYGLNYLKLEEENADEIRTIFFLSGHYMMTDYGGTGFPMDSYLLTAYNLDPGMTAMGIIYNIMPQEGLKDVLWKAVLEHMRGNERGYTMSRTRYLNWEPESAVPDWPVENMYATLIENFEEEVVNQKIIAYLKDTSAEQDCITFLKELYLELEGE